MIPKSKNKDYSIIMAHTILNEAFKEGDIEKVKGLIKFINVNDLIRNPNKHTFLKIDITLIPHGRRDILKALLDEIPGVLVSDLFEYSCSYDLDLAKEIGARILNSANHFRLVLDATHYAAMDKHEINIMDAMSAAICENKVEIMKYLKEYFGCDRDMIRRIINEELIFSGYYEKGERWHFEKKIVDNGDTFYDGENIDVDMVKSMVEDFGLQYEDLCSEKTNAIEQALYDGDIEVVRYLIEKFGLGRDDLLNSRGPRFGSIEQQIVAACANGTQKTISFFKDMGIDVKEWIANTDTNQRNFIRTMMGENDVSIE